TGCSVARSIPPRATIDGKQHRARTHRPLAVVCGAVACRSGGLGPGCAAGADRAVTRKKQQAWGRAWPGLGPAWAGVGAGLGRVWGGEAMHVVIVGAGIGGLTLALMLHRRRLACEVYEASPRMRKLGVGINVLPHAIAELGELGLLQRLDAVGV